MRRALAPLAVAALAGVIVIGLTQAGDSTGGAEPAAFELDGETAFVHQGGYGTEAKLVADIEAHLG